MKDLGNLWLPASTAETHLSPISQNDSVVLLKVSFHFYIFSKYLLLNFSLIFFPRNSAISRHPSQFMLGHVFAKWLSWNFNSNFQNMHGASCRKPLLSFSLLSMLREIARGAITSSPPPPRSGQLITFCRSPSHQVWRHKFIIVCGRKVRKKSTSSLVMLWLMNVIKIHKAYTCSL